MMLGSVSLMKFRFDNQLLKILFILNLLYSVTIVLRGSQYDFNSSSCRCSRHHVRHLALLRVGGDAASRNINRTKNIHGADHPGRLFPGRRRSFL